MNGEQQEDGFRVDVFRARAELVQREVVPDVDVEGRALKGADHPARYLHHPFAERGSIGEQHDSPGAWMQAPNQL